MSDFYVKIGETTTFAKTVSESDVYQFSGITGDFSPNHINKVYMERSSYGRLMAHGALLVGYMSTVSTMAISNSRNSDETPVAVGYDKIRFLKPVYIGDTVCIHYVISVVDIHQRRSTAQIEVKNQENELVAVADHILQWVPNK